MFVNENWGDGPQYVPGPMDNVINPNKLHEAYLKCQQGVSWKGSVQKYGLNELSNIVNIISKISDFEYEIGSQYEFTLNERGHLRYIKALSILDRVVQRSFNDNVLNPAIKNFLIYDNGASQKGKGLSFSRERFEHHLRSAYYEYGHDAYILLIDFSKYFDNILHSEILKQLSPFMTQDEMWYLEQTFRSFEIDVSYLSDEEFMNYKDYLFNMMDYSSIDKSLLTGEKMMPKSVGIGNQTSQAVGVFYPHEIDNYCKIVKGIKYYGRYTDDTYIIAKTKEELLATLQEISVICDKLGIHINERKTHIQPLSSEIQYLKIRHLILDTGRILKFIPSSTLRREKRRITKFKKLYDEGRMSLTDILQCFVSWRGSYSKFDSKRKMYIMECFFKDTFFINREVDLQDMLRRMIREETKEMQNKKLLKKV